jgi:hypothetical protein
MNLQKKKRSSPKRNPRNLNSSRRSRVWRKNFLKVPRLWQKQCSKNKSFLRPRPPLKIEEESRLERHRKSKRKRSKL